MYFFLPIYVCVCVCVCVHTPVCGGIGTVTYK